jgi:DNA polymerase-4
MKKFIHIDMDCFFAAVEMRDNPAYRDIPLAVGGTSRRGVLSTCNYQARAFGVHSAMATAKALQLCPSLTVVPGRMAAYKEASQQVQQIFTRYSDKIEPISIDEAYLDVSDSTLFKGSATLIANDIRRCIKHELNLTASAGIAPNKFIAKIASDENKPDGFFVVEPKDVKSFARELALKKIPGVGKVTLQKLNNLGLYKGEDVLAFSPLILHESFGQFADVLYRRCQGEDNREICTDRVRKSVGVETTYEHDLNSYQQCAEKIESLYIQLKKRLERTQMAHRVNKLGIKIKFADFTSTTVDQHGATLDIGIFKALVEKGFQRGQGKRVRLLGLNLGIADKPQFRQFVLPFD